MSINTKTQKKRTLLTLSLSVSIFLSMISITLGSVVASEENKNLITSITAQEQDQTIIIKVVCSKEPAYTIYELFNPSRIVVDIAESAPANNLFFNSNAKATILMTASSVSETNPPLTRFEFTLPESMPFHTTLDDKNILITLKSKSNTSEQNIQTQQAATSGTTIAINEISTTTSANETTVLLKANGPIAQYTYDVLDKDKDNPPRLYIDVNNVAGEELLPEQHIGTALKRIRVAKRDTGLRFVFDSSQDLLFPFQIHEIENALKITITEHGQEVDQIGSLINQKQTIEEQLPQIHPISEPGPITDQNIASEPVSSPKTESASEKMKDKFSFTGYNKQRISVDFYKIDLHNVFRLIKEISGQNIIVDESVSGSLTLALNDVPWDFALDIILNLNDLQKEERFDTIVILPKSKQFAWPNRAEDNLTFEAVEEIVSEEAIVIQQRESLSPEIIAAKELISKAMDMEKDGDYENAATQYKEALNKWPQNGNLAKKLSSLYLVQLQHNVNGIHYAKKALNIDKNDTKAALNAAIGLANMHNFPEAQEYFDQSVSDEIPSRESLLSYAVFCEENKKFDAALTLLQKHDHLHGESLDSMLAQARIFDKQGNDQASSEKYSSILLSGFQIPPDLRQYINGRLSLSQQK